MRKPEFTRDYKGFKILVYLDDCPMDPMDCEELVGYYIPVQKYKHLSNANDEFEIWKEEIKDCRIEANATDLYYCAEDITDLEVCEFKDLIALPLYAYSHSSFSLSTAEFSCPWDSGRIGLVYISVEAAAEAFMVEIPEVCYYDEAKAAKRHKAKVELRKRVDCALRASVEEYSNYLSGNAYCFSVDDPNGVEVVGLTGGYLGFQEQEDSFLLEEAHEEIDALIGRADAEEYRLQDLYAEVVHAIATHVGIPSTYTIAVEDKSSAGTGLQATIKIVHRDNKERRKEFLFTLSE